MRGFFLLKEEKISEEKKTEEFLLLEKLEQNLNSLTPSLQKKIFNKKIGFFSSKEKNLCIL